jgi:APA family basic amino acid/polyamine antiporter
MLLLLNSSRATTNLYTFMLLLSTAAIIVLYAVGSLAAWRASTAFHQRAVIVIALLFVLFAAYGTGLEANLWCIALLAVGLAIRAVMHRLNSRAETNLPVVAIPVATPESSA